MSFHKCKNLSYTKKQILIQFIDNPGKGLSTFDFHKVGVLNISNHITQLTSLGAVFDSYKRDIYDPHDNFHYGVDFYIFIGWRLDDE